jgi:hypothetical protein
MGAECLYPDQSAVEIEISDLAQKCIGVLSSDPALRQIDTFHIETSDIVFDAEGDMRHPRYVLFKWHAGAYAQL